MVEIFVFFYVIYVIFGNKIDIYLCIIVLLIVSVVLDYMFVEWVLDVFM